MIPVLPESAPFSAEQRAWLNGFFAGLLGIDSSLAGSGVDDDTPAEEISWHDPSLTIEERMALAEGRPLEQRMMAAMAQLDCGACGYVCQTYSAALARGEEKSLTLCAPGGRETAAKLKELLRGANGEGQATSSATAPAGSPQGASDATAPQPTATPGSSRDAPFTARVIRSQPLTGEGSTRPTSFVALDLSGGDVSYEVGDSLDIFPRNCPELVQEIIEALGASGEEALGESDASGMTLRDALTSRRAITAAGDELLGLLERHAASRIERERIRSILGNGVDAFLEGRDVVDLLGEFPSARPPAAELVMALPRLQPRLYSISSSLRAHSAEVHLTVGVVRYATGSRIRKGVASTFLAERVGPGTPVDVFVHPSPRFRLPRDGGTPVIMVGPGTGVAPFRAFLEERRATGATGRNWLFFGARNREHDYLYRDEIERATSEGLLSRLDLAFSRDSDEKVYVQHRMLEHGAELWAWLEDGAHLYVCGDARRMARDVDATLREIVRRHGGRSGEAADEYVASLASSARYQRDVY